MFVSPCKSCSLVTKPCRFACTAPTALDSEGNYASSSETLELAMSQETFTSLAQRYQFSGCLDAWRYRATSGSASRKIEYDDAGEATSSSGYLRPAIPRQRE
jgi:hypothetical protein